MAEWTGPGQMVVEPGGRITIVLPSRTWRRIKRMKRRHAQQEKRRRGRRTE